jgi:hypothetical protein
MALSNRLVARRAVTGRLRGGGRMTLRKSPSGLKGLLAAHLVPRP